METLRRIRQRVRELFCRHDNLKWKAGVDLWLGECVKCGKKYSGRVLNQISLGALVDPEEEYDA